MPVVIEICDPAVDESALEQAFSWLRYVDATFSTYDRASEISRHRRGELALNDTQFAVRSVLARCEELRERTDGYFDAHAAGRGAGVDPSGLVKGWSVVGAVRILERAGARNFCVDAGGDIVVRGEAPQGGAWQIGIQHPLDRDAIACTVALRNAAIATSGAYERGEHVIDPHRGVPAEGLLSVSVIGPDLVVADAYATAALAMGARRAVDWCVTQPGWDFMFVTDEECVLTTPGFDRRLER